MVSIPVRVLDVLKRIETPVDELVISGFNPCKGFRCFEACFAHMF